MRDLNKKLNEVGLKVPHILLPNENINLSKFSCIAADQYTQSTDYWDRVKSFVGENPSTFNLIYPEAYLEKDKEDKNNFDEILKNKINTINSNMKKYIDDGVYEDIGTSFVYVERETSNGTRHGLIVAIDLEEYDYNEGAKTLMRATEKTVTDRLVVRREIRDNATLDMPHILVLINDENNKLFKELNTIKNKIKNIKDSDSNNNTNNNQELYNFDLMENGGHINDYKISNENDLEKIADILIELKNKSDDGFLYAVGDGNHSLAAAKDVYKKTGRGRYALVEINNIYDEGLKFYPIHRFIMNVDRNKFIKDTGIDPDNPLPLQEMQRTLDKFNYKIDYIHGKDECIRLAKEKNGIAITYDEFDVSSLFSDVIKHGSLCRKSFSMGEAQDKRYYLEAQLIL